MWAELVLRPNLATAWVEDWSFYYFGVSRTPPRPDTQQPLIKFRQLSSNPNSATGCEMANFTFIISLGLQDSALFSLALYFHIISDLQKSGKYEEFPYSLPMCCVLSHFSCVRLFATWWTLRSPPGSSVHGILPARKSMGFSWQEYWSELPCPPPDLPNPGVELVSFTSPSLAGGFFTTRAIWEAHSLSLDFPISSHPITSTPAFPSSSGLFLKYLLLLIYLTVPGLRCSMQTQLWQMGFSSPSRDQTSARLHWECVVLATGPSGNSLQCYFYPISQPSKQAEGAGSKLASFSFSFWSEQQCTFIECLICAWHCSKHFSSISDHRKWGLWSSPLCRCGSWGTVPNPLCLESHSKQRG